MTYRAAHFSGRETERRKDDRYLFVALNNTEFIQDWIDQIEQQQVNLVGIYLHSMMSQCILDRLQLKQPHLLLTEQLASGLRQSYFHHGKLRLSRLTPMPDASWHQLPYFYNSEIEKTRFYLVAQRLIARDLKLTVLLADRNGKLEEVCKNIRLEQTMDCHTIDFSGFSQSPANETTTPHELLYMHMLALGNVPENLAPPKLIQPYRITTLRRWISAFAFFILLGGLITSGCNAYKNYELEREITNVQMQTQAQQQRYLEISKDFPVTPIPSVSLQIVSELHDKIMHVSKQQPERMMLTLSQSLENAPAIKMNRMRWVLSNDAKLKDTDQLASNQLLQMPQPDQSTTLSMDSSQLYEMAFINGEIKNFRGDYRAANHTVKQWVETLKRNPEVLQVTLLQQPVNTNSLTDLQGSTADIGQNQAAAAQFKILLILNLKQPS